MRYVVDRTGRFLRRPLFTEREIDTECEEVVTAFLRERYGEVRYPILTNDLVILIESRVELLDQYADLSDEGDDVEGATYFERESLPHVCISRALTEQPRLENRRRTTLTHELGHVHFHQPLWAGAMEAHATPSVGDDGRAICKRESIVGGRSADWMEWQAAYACGAFLMPLSEVRTLLASQTRPGAPPSPLSLPGADLIESVRRAFDVSTMAARVRLQQLGYIARDR